MSPMRWLGLLLLGLALLSLPTEAQQKRPPSEKKKKKPKEKKTKEGKGKKKDKKKKRKAKRNKDDPPDINDMEDVGEWMFARLDENEDGFITKKEMEEATKDMQGKATSERRKKDYTQAEKADAAAEELLKMGAMLFQTLDTNQDNKISKKEMSFFGAPPAADKDPHIDPTGADTLGRLMQSNMERNPDNSGFRYRKQTMGFLMFQEMDKDKNKKITREEFIEFRDANEVVQGAKGADIDPVFMSMDRDKNGYITLEEAEGYYAVMEGQINEEMAEQEL